MTGAAASNARARADDLQPRNRKARSLAMIKLKRVYEPATVEDGVRLVERLWPRGVKKASLRLDAWLKEAAPSNELRRWFDHDPKKWEAFRRRYFSELDRRPEAWEPILVAARRGPATLLYSSHDRDHNNALALMCYLEDIRLRSVK